MNCQFPICSKKWYSIIVTVIISLKLFFFNHLSSFFITLFTNHSSYEYAINLCVTLFLVTYYIFIIFGTISCNIPSFIGFEASSAFFPMCWATNQFKTFLLGVTRFTTMIRYHFFIDTLPASIFSSITLNAWSLFSILLFIHHHFNQQSLYHNNRSHNYPGLRFEIPPIHQGNSLYFQ